MLNEGNGNERVALERMANAVCGSRMRTLSQCASRGDAVDIARRTRDNYEGRARAVMEERYIRTKWVSFRVQRRLGRSPDD